MKHKLLIYGLVYGTSIGCLVWVFHGVDFGKLAHNLAGVSWPYLLLAALLNLSVYFANTWRWTILLSPVTPARFRRALQAIYIGLFLNDVLPLRPGEIVRCGLLSSWTRGLSLTVAISSAMVERLVEFAWLAAAFFALVAFAPVPKALVYGCSIASAVLLVVSGLLVLKVRRSRPGSAHPSQSRLLRIWHQFVDGLRLMANPPTMSIVAAMSLLALVLNMLAAWALLHSCRILVPLLIAAAVVIIIRVGTAIPSTPGSVGAYQFFAVLALGLFGVDKTAAATFTVVAFAAFTFPLLIGGAAAFALAGADFSEILSLLNRPRSKDLAVEPRREG